MNNTYTILISDIIKLCGGRISWESDKIGVSNYTPNVSINSCKELREVSSKRLKKINILVLDPLSMNDLKQDCQFLQKYIDNDTIIFICTNFGCELEPFVIENLNGKYKCVISVLCDSQFRQVAQNKFHIQDNCNVLDIYMGITYMSSNFKDEMHILMSQNESSIQKQFSRIDSTLNQVINKLLDDWIFVKKYETNTSTLPLLIWESIIPKISLNILLIVHEVYDYKKFLENKDVLKFYKNLVLELMNICCMQCGLHVANFLYPNDKRKINFNKILETGFDGKENLECTFEYYCFKTGYLFPFDILLSQTILLAKRYEMKCSNLISLQESYKKLEQKSTQFAPESSTEDIDCVPVLSTELKKLYIDAESLPRTTIEQESEMKSTTTQTPSEVVLNGMCATNVTPVNCLQYLKDSIWTTDFETQGVVGIPHYPSSRTHNPIKKNTYVMNESIRSLEKQIRTKKHLFANDYDRINSQLITNGGRPYTEHSRIAQKLKYGSRDTQLWKLQRKLNIERGLLGASPTRPYEDLLNHIRILNRANTGDVLPFTTARFGKVDTFHLLNENKDHIMALFEPVPQQTETEQTETE